MRRTRRLLRRHDEIVNEANCLAEVGEALKVKELVLPLLHCEQKVSRRRFLSNLILKGFANCGDLLGAEAWYQQMVESKISVSQRTFGKMVKCAAKAGEAERAERWFSEASLAPAPQVMISLVEAFARSQDALRASAWHRRLRQLDERDVQSVRGRGAELMAWAHLGDLPKAMSTVSSEMNLVDWIGLLEASAKSSNWQKASELFHLGLKIQLQPNVAVYTSVIDAHARARRPEVEPFVLKMLLNLPEIYRSSILI